MNETKKLTSQKPVEQPKASYNVLPELPRHFSAISAQKTGKPHDEESHQRMVHELRTRGYHPADTQGHYGAPEKSVMIEHQGTPVDHKTIESIAFHGFGQESVVHSSQGHDGERKNKLVYSDAAKTSEHGSGVEWGHHLSDHYSELPSGHRFQLKLGNNVEKSDHHKKPHYYGKLDGVHIFHGSHDYHKNLVGHHIENPTEDQFKTALHEAKGKGSGVVVIHGAPPESLRSRIHSKLGPVLPGALKKAFLQPDGETKTDAAAHANSVAALPKWLLKWGAENLSKLPKQAVESIPLKEHQIKVRKLDSDLYSGWVEKDSQKIHSFERVTMPELLMQLLSKLELYDTEEVGEKLKDLKDKVASAATKPEEPAYDFDKELEGFNAKFQEAFGKFPEEHMEEVSGKELSADGDQTCEDCGSEKLFCECYKGLPLPEIHFDLNTKKLSIFFKSEWEIDSRLAFLEDMKKRATSLVLAKVEKE